MEFRLGNGELIVVDDDCAHLMTGTWNVGTTGVVKRSRYEQGKVRTDGLNIVLMGRKAPEGHVWVHADGDWRNFRRKNIVAVPRGKHTDGLQRVKPEQRVINPTKALETRARKNRRTKRFVGVQANGKKFRAVAMVFGKQTHLGTFDTREDAARAYDQSRRDQGLSPVNFPDPR